MTRTIGGIPGIFCLEGKERFSALTITASASISSGTEIWQ